jgi:hypothetical protein
VKSVGFKAGDVKRELSRDSVRTNGPENFAFGFPFTFLVYLLQK